ncbi:hypothetical protein L6164_022262 [Bauhinia variegata]|uniref:Uncharacterized protein n=1 Tax=Bauhinia variegata TaxID=167791 RepID=A0ACB9MEQ4_BAUVA|nr:hypothetical protein L6164_022262 [Bauhinia variegata]
MAKVKYAKTQEEMVDVHAFDAPTICLRSCEEVVWEKGVSSGLSKICPSEFNVVSGSSRPFYTVQSYRTLQVVQIHMPSMLEFSPFSDEIYGTIRSVTLSLLHPRTPTGLYGEISQVHPMLERSCLHADLEHVHFFCQLLVGFYEILSQLRGFGNEYIFPTTFNFLIGQKILAIQTP